MPTFIVAGFIQLYSTVPQPFRKPLINLINSYVYEAFVVKHCLPTLYHLRA